MKDWVAGDQSFESIPDGETDQIREISGLMQLLLQQRYADQPRILRAVHAKSHGCVRATFNVETDLAEDLCVGLFASPGACYEAVIRFSNAAAHVDDDVRQIPTEGGTLRIHGSRGMAIKIRGIPSAGLEPTSEPGTQDFLLINLPVFPFANVADYLELTRAQLEHDRNPTALFQVFAANVPAPHVVRAGAIIKTNQETPVSSPLESPYFSAAPFLFGADRVMKVAVFPADATSTPLPDVLDRDYLHHVLASQLREREARFDFCVQVRAPGEDLAIEDASIEWEERISPFRKVASLTIKRQEIDSEFALEACERLFFTPWHTLPEHRPLGGINRLRREAYIASFDKRRESLESTHCAAD